MEKDIKDEQQYLSTDYFRKQHRDKKGKKSSQYIIDVTGQFQAKNEFPHNHDLRLAALRKRYHKKEE
jgi:hypothetical protein